MRLGVAISFLEYILCGRIKKDYTLHPILAGGFVNDDRVSIALLRDDPRIEDMMFFTPQSQDKIRMELVYELNSNIKHIDVSSDSALYSNMPFVFLSKEPAENYFKGKNVSFEPLGRFDNNWKKKDSKGWNPNLANYATIIKSSE